MTKTLNIALRLDADELGAASLSFSLAISPLFLSSSVGVVVGVPSLDGCSSVG